MGGWQLEVAKMAIYMSFPVALFHYFNQPRYFEDWVTKMKRELYPPESKQYRAQFEEAARFIREREDLKMLKSVEENET